MNNKGQMVLWIVLAVIVGLLIISVGYTASKYNSLVSGDEVVNEQWANVLTQYQRRADLIPNLVNTVQGVVEFEQGTQTQIAALRSQAQAVSQQIQSAGSPAELEAAANELDNVVSGYRGLNINVENYPQLRGVESFLSLQDELAGTENRVQVARERYNAAVKEYNLQVRRFPGNFIASMFGFEQREFFEADEGASAAPTVDFS